MNPILGENDQTPSKTVYHVTYDFKFYWVTFCPNLQTATSRTLPTELRKTQRICNVINLQN